MAEGSQAEEGVDKYNFSTQLMVPAVQKDFLELLMEKTAEIVAFFFFSSNKALKRESRIFAQRWKVGS